MKVVFIFMVMLSVATFVVIGALAVNKMDADTVLSDKCAERGMTFHMHIYSPVFCIDESGRVFLFDQGKGE